MKAAILRQIVLNDENNDLNVNVEGQWDRRSCMPCMHPGIVDQTGNGLTVKEECNLLMTDQSDEEDKDYDDCDRFDNINEANSQDSAQKKSYKYVGYFECIVAYSELT